MFGPSSAVMEIPFGEMSRSATRQSFSSRSLASASPMPEAAPVMSATLDEVDMA